MELDQSGPWTPIGLLWHCRIDCCSTEIELTVVAGFVLPIESYTVEIMAQVIHALALNFLDYVCISHQKGLLNSTVRVPQNTTRA